MRLIIILVLLTGCGSKFDSFDPTTSVLKWMIKNEKK
jgi:hypothetical protein|tara:strand:- start:1564 stop:1674 length:111 start_codon:yes stop_codon:yes gene_type:complete